MLCFLLMCPLTFSKGKLECWCTNLQLFQSSTWTVLYSVSFWYTDLFDVPIGYFCNNPLVFPIYFSIIWFSISLIKIINIWIVLIIYLLVLINHKIVFNLSVELRWLIVNLKDLFNLKHFLSLNTISAWRVLVLKKPH